MNAKLDLLKDLALFAWWLWMVIKVHRTAERLDTLEHKLKNGEKL